MAHYYTDEQEWREKNAEEEIRHNHRRELERNLYTLKEAQKRGEIGSKASIKRQAKIESLEEQIKAMKAKWFTSMSEIRRAVFDELSSGIEEAQSKVDEIKTALAEALDCDAILIIQTNFKEFVTANEHLFLYSEVDEIARQTETAALHSHLIAYINSLKEQIISSAQFKAPGSNLMKNATSIYRMQAQASFIDDFSVMTGILNLLDRSEKYYAHVLLDE